MMDSPKHEAYENGGTIVNRYARIAIAVLASVGLLTSASACGTSQNGAGSAHGAISVVSSINQWGTLAEQLGGSGVQVTSIINSTNVDAHDYEPTTSDIAKLQKARIVIVNGAGYDSWAVKAAQSAKSQVINAAEIGGVKDGGNPHVWFSAKVRSNTADATPKGYAQASANESEPTPADIKDFQDTLKAGFIKMFVFNSQEANSTTDQITGAAKDANVPIVELAEQMPKQYTNLLDWMSALVDQFAAAVK